MTVRVLDEKWYDPPRDVEVFWNGAWWPAIQHLWRLCDDHRGWMADVEVTTDHDWGRGKYRPMVPADHIRLPVDNRGTTAPR